MNMQINVPQEAISLAVESLTNALADIAKENKDKSQIGAAAKSLTESAVLDVQKGDFDRAILKLQEALKIEPGYNRGRLLLAHSYKGRGYNNLAIWVGGGVAAKAEDGYTKMQAANMAGVICLDAYKADRTRGIVFEEAESLFSLAIEGDPTCPVPRWNLAECHTLRGDEKACSAALRE